MKALHLIQRARTSCFLDISDRLAYLDFLVTFATHCGSLVHAYVLMPNHVHLLLTARNSDALELDRHLRGSRQLQDTEVRPVHVRRYLLACMRYIELNPVRAQMVSQPQDYRWSSYRANALGYRDLAVTPHPFYYTLGRTPEARQRAYSAFLRRRWSDFSG